MPIFLNPPILDSDSKRLTKTRQVIASCSDDINICKIM